MERNRVGREASPDCNRSTQVNTRSAHPQDTKHRTKISSSSVSHTASSTALDASGLLNHTVTLDPPSVVLPGARGRRRLLAARAADAFERQATNEQKRFRNQRPVAASPVHRSRDPMAMAERGLRHVASHSPPKTRSRTAAASGVSQPTLGGEHNKGGRGASPFHRAATRDASSGFLHELSPLMSSQIMPSWQQLSSFLPNSEVANRPDPHAPSLGKSASLVEKSAEALRSWTQHQASTKSAVLHPRRQMQDTRTHTPPPPPHQITPVPLPLSAASPFPEPMHPQSPLGIPPNAATQETNDMKVVAATSSALEGVAVTSATAVPSLKKDTVFENASQDVLSQSGEEDDQPHIQLEQTIPRRRSPNISCGASSSGDADSISMDQQHADAGRVSLHDRTLELSSLVKTRVRRMNHHAKHRTPQAADSHSVIIPVCTTSGNPTVQELESIQHLIGQLQTYVSLAQRESSSPPSCSLSSNEANMAEDETAEHRGQNRMFFGLPAAEPLGQEDSLVASSESSNGSSHSKPRRVNPKFPCFDRILADVNSKSAKKNFQSSQSPTSRPGAKMTPNAGSSGTSSVDCTMDGLTNERYERVVHHIESVAKNMPAAVARTKRLGEGMDAWLASWNALQSVSTVFGEAIYADLLRANPKYRYLFICAMEATTTELRPSQRLTNMLKQAVMAFLIPEETVTILTEMGARHQLYRVHEEHYAAMQRGFFKALKQFLPTSMYTASLPSWRLFWRVTVDMLVCGLHSDRGRFYEEKYRELWACRVQQLIPKLLQKQKGRNGDECDNHFFVDVFNRALEQDPSIIRFQRLRTIRTSDRAMESLRRIVEHLNNRAVVETYLEDLSSKHESYGISSTILKQFKRPFLETFAQYMSDEPLYSPVAARAMAELWDYITSTWSSSSIENSQLEVNNAIAPHGDEHFCLMFTDVEASTRLWDYKPEVMAAAVQNHHRIIRSLINDYDAYEVKTVGDSFLIATKDALTALKIALAIQLEFMRGPIAKGFKMVEHTQGGGDPKCWRDDSLRIRIGIHYCTDVSAVYDTVHQRYDYYGPDVNCAARVEASACGGQVLMTKAALDALHAIPEFMTEPRPRLLGGFDSTQFLGETTSTDEPLSSVVSFVDEGCRLMKGIADPVQLFGVIHRSLAGREFEDDTSRTMSMSSFDSFIASSMIS